MNVILSAILPVGFIVLIGFIVGTTLSLEQKTLSRLVLYVLFPALIADTLYRTTLTGEDVFTIVVGFTLIYFILGIIAWNIGYYLGFSLDLRKSLVATTALANSGNMGLPIILFALGEAGLERGVIYLIAWNLVVLITMPGFLQAGGFLSSIRFTFKLPLFWAILFGISFNQFNIQLPLRLDEGLHLLSESAVPMALILLGLQIAGSSLQLTRYEMGASLMRLFGGLIISYSVGKMIGVDTIDLKVFMLQGSMPTAITAFIMVNEFGGDAERTARVVVVSTLFSFLLLPVVLLMIQYWI
ncbi:MAG: AEC family transporter [Microcoleaceae cyanobacterium]